MDNLNTLLLTVLSRWEVMCLAVCRVCVHIILMTNGEFLRSYSLIVVQRCQERQYESCVSHIWITFLGYAELSTLTESGTS